MYHSKIVHLIVQYMTDNIEFLNIFLKIEEPHVLILTEQGLIEEEMHCVKFNYYNVISFFFRTIRKSSGRQVILTRINVKMIKIDVNIFSKEIPFEFAGVAITEKHENVTMAIVIVIVIFIEVIFINYIRISINITDRKLVDYGQ